MSDWGIASELPDHCRSRRDSAYNGLVGKALPEWIEPMAATLKREPGKDKRAAEVIRDST